MANAVTNQLLSDMRILHTQTSRGIWGKGATTHETVARREGDWLRDGHYKTVK